MGVFDWTASSVSPSSASQLSSTPSHGKMAFDHGPDRQPQLPAASIFKLPPEIIQYILSFLDVQHLQSLYRTCRNLKAHVEDEQLWLPLLKANLPDHDVPKDPVPAPSYRQLYLAQHPYWFLPHHRIWFSDDAYNGKLIMIKFNPMTGTISGCQLVAERPPVQAQVWSLKPSVVIHHVNPRVYLSTDDPVLSLTYSNDLNYSNGSASRSWNPSSEVRMRVGRPEQKINASLMLSKDLPDSTANTPNVVVWPPRTIPNMPRTRSSTGNNSGNSFMAKGHKPSALDEISQTTFRLRTWSNFTQGMLNLGVRIGEEVSTWSTLDPTLYRPTPQKPYQGLYVGEYAAHGCEFLLVLQTEQAPKYQRHVFPGDNSGGGGPERRNYLSAVLAALREQQLINDEDEANIYHDYGVNNDRVPGQSHTTAHGNAYSQENVSPNVEDPDGTIHMGAIEAIKITGDVNVPRGEHTFIADDIGPKGTIRIAHESPFRGARVVMSRGHVAARGFRDGENTYFTKRPKQIC